MSQINFESYEKNLMFIRDEVEKSILKMNSFKMSGNDIVRLDDLIFELDLGDFLPYQSLIKENKDLFLSKQIDVFEETRKKILQNQKWATLVKETVGNYDYYSTRSLKKIKRSFRDVNALFDVNYKSNGNFFLAKLLMDGLTDIVEPEKKLLMKYFIVQEVCPYFFQEGLEYGMKLFKKMGINDKSEFEKVLNNYLDIFNEVSPMILNRGLQDKGDYYSYLSKEYSSYYSDEAKKAKEKINELYKDVCFKYMPFILTPYKFAPESFDYFDVLIDKWKNISDEIVDDKGYFTDKQFTKVKKFFFTKIVNIHKIQEKLIKSNDSKAIDINEKIMSELPKYAKKFKTDIPKVTLDIELNKVYKINKTNAVFDLKEFTKETGFTKKDIKEYIKFLEDAKYFSYIYKQNENRTRIFLKNQKDGFELIVQYKYPDEEELQHEDMFGKYLLEEIYSEILINLDIYKKNDLSNKSMYESKNTKLFKSVLIDEKAEEIALKIRENKLYEKMITRKQPDEQVKSVRKKI